MSGKASETSAILLLLQVQDAGDLAEWMKVDSRLRTICRADMVYNPTGIKRSRLFKHLQQQPCSGSSRPLETEALPGDCRWQLTTTQLPRHYTDARIHPTGGKKKKIISSSTLGHYFCGLWIHCFTPTCWYDINSRNRHQAMKSSEECDCRANCFLALYCLVIVKWNARLAQAHGVCVRSRELQFSVSYQLFLTSPIAFYKKQGIC